MMTLQGLDDGGSSDVFATTRTSVPGHQRKISCWANDVRFNP